MNIAHNSFGILSGSGTPVLPFAAMTTGSFITLFTSNFTQPSPRFPPLLPSDGASLFTSTVVGLHELLRENGSASLIAFIGPTSLDKVEYSPIAPALKPDLIGIMPVSPREPTKEMKVGERVPVGNSIPSAFLIAGETPSLKTYSTGPRCADPSGPVDASSSPKPLTGGVTVGNEEETWFSH